jgi:hypothetical protein
MQSELHSLDLFNEGRDYSAQMYAIQTHIQLRLIQLFYYYYHHDHYCCREKSEIESKFDILIFTYNES